MINWFTIVAEIINFVILVVLLKYLLYKRIIDAMDKREATIASRLEDAEQRQRKAKAQAEECRRKEQELEDRREDLLDEARQDAEAHRNRLVQEARDETSELRSRWARTVHDEQEQFLRSLSERAGREICEISRTLLADLADTELERQVIDSFLGQLEGMEETQRQTLAESLRDGGGTATIRTAFQLDEDRQGRIIDAVHRQIAAGCPIEFVHDPTLIAGIELRAGGHAVAWNIEAYLARLTESVGGLLTEVQPSEPTELSAHGSVPAAGKKTKTFSHEQESS